MKKAILLKSEKTGEYYAGIEYGEDNPAVKTSKNISEAKRFDAIRGRAMCVILGGFQRVWLSAELEKMSFADFPAG